MKTPLDNKAVWLELESVSSTQTILVEKIKEGEPIGVVYAREQTAGRGRFTRTWISHIGDSLTFSMAFHGYGDHPKAYLVGMSVAIAAAGQLHCQLRWPNDLTYEGKKLGGILSEIVTTPQGERVPIVGVGINLNQLEFPEEIAETATSARRVHGGTYDPKRVANRIIERLVDLPEPDSWSLIEPAWSLFDRTPGKMYRLANGDIAVAIGIGSDGQLICSVDGESHSVLAADAIFGT